MKLAVVGKVIETAEIKGADRIKQALVVCGGAGKWSGVVGLDIEVGQLVTVLLQDALLPPNDRWVFMEKHKWRVRMARFKGVPSECVILSGAPDAPPGTDLTESLGITKYEKPIPAAMQGDAIAAFPSFIPKTDEPNFQTVPEMVAMMDRGWYATEKADGTSCTVWRDSAGLHVCSRNWELREFDASGKTNLYWIAARKYELETRLSLQVALQFEVVGPGIQGNPMGLKEIEGRLFTVRCADDGWAKQSMEDVGFWSRKTGMPMARMFAVGEGVKSADELRAMADIEYPNGKPAEGIVIRGLDGGWRFKVLNLAYKD